MKIFIQGMRRSGTTVVYDVLCQNPDFDAYYEPFGPAKSESRGGGSGLQPINFAAKTRAVRERFCAESHEVSDPSFFNYGAPRDPGLELDSTLPESCQGYLRSMLETSPHTLIKFVRMFEKIPYLRELAPDSKLLHVVRDPRRVAISQMYGRNWPEEGIKKRKVFKRRKQDGFLWASRELSERLLERAEYSRLKDPSDLERVLLVWKHSFRRTYESGRAHFGDDYMILRHEDLAARPARCLKHLYRFLGCELPPALVTWAEQNLRAPGPPAHADAPEWQEAFERVELGEELRLAGYAERPSRWRSWLAGQRTSVRARQ